MTSVLYVDIFPPLLRKSFHLVEVRVTASLPLALPPPLRGLLDVVDRCVYAVQLERGLLRRD
jgi:hypothetical protein